VIFILADFWGKLFVVLSEEVPQLRWVVWGRRSTRKRGVWVAWARLLGRREALQIRRKRNMISGEAMVTYHAEVEEFLGFFP
jgi:hypothetical protein